ncbi:MAG: Sua5/YciO/YrdC/YwlC family protein [Proteobacteria bacterium]|nr:Sua5/YciO/YrdC/YwlC family protein [Pseudomonadota bacterium]
MSLLNFKDDAQRAFDVLQAGGIAILPNDVGYSLMGGSARALKKIFDTKQRAPAKLNAMLGNADIHEQLHLVSVRSKEIIQAITEDYDLPLGIIAPCRPDQPMLQQMDRETYQRSTRDNTLLMLLNAGRFHAEICKLSFQHQHPLFGSSANISLSGTKFRVEDINPEIRAIADITIDYGLLKYHLYGCSSTLLEIETLSVQRFGSCYENIADILKRHFRIELPPNPTPTYRERT